MKSGFDSIIVKGRVTEGLRESCFFTNLSWVREQFVAKLGIDPYPGTFNLDILDEDLAKYKEVKSLEGIEIIPEPGFCPAKCFHVLVCDRISGAVVIPLVPNYPELKMEIVSAYNIREALSLKSGDIVSVEIYY